MNFQKLEQNSQQRHYIIGKGGIDMYQIAEVARMLNVPQATFYMHLQQDKFPITVNPNGKKYMTDEQVAKVKEFYHGEPVNANTLRLNLFKLKDELTKLEAESITLKHKPSNSDLANDHAYLVSCNKLKKTELQHDIKNTQLQLQKLHTESIEKKLTDNEFDVEGRKAVNEELHGSIDTEHILAKQTDELQREVAKLTKEKNSAFKRTNEQVALRRVNMEQNTLKNREQKRIDEKMEMVNWMKEAFLEAMKEHNNVKN